MGSRFYRYAQMPLRAKASPKGFRAGAQPTLLNHLTAVLVDEAQVGVLVAQVQSGCRLWLLFATIHSGPILLSFGPLARESPYSFCRPTGYCVGGRPSHLIFLELRAREVSTRPGCSHTLRFWWLSLERGSQIPRRLQIASRIVFLRDQRFSSRSPPCPRS